MNKTLVRARTATKSASQNGTHKVARVTQKSAPKPSPRSRPQPDTQIKPARKATPLAKATSAASAKKSTAGAGKSTARTSKNRSVAPAKAKSATSRAVATKSATAKSSSQPTAKSKAKTSKIQTPLEPGVLRATKKRAPKDLASQYGENSRKKRAPKVTAKEKKQRRDAATRIKMKEMMTPDDEVLARLARAGVIASSLVPETASPDSHNARQQKTPATRRSRKWQSQCGKCGTVSTFPHGAVGLCSRCGAIAVRD